MNFLDYFRPKWQHSNSDIRRKEVEKTTDQSLLYTIYKKEKSDSIRVVAFWKITHQDYLKKVAEGGFFPSFLSRLIAMESILQHKYLGNVAKTVTDNGREDNTEMLEMLVPRLNDPEILQTLSITDKVRFFTHKQMKTISD